MSPISLVRFELTITTISPVHVGTGEKFVPGADLWVSRQPNGSRVAQVLDVDRALDWLAEQNQDIRRVDVKALAPALGEQGRAASAIATLGVHGTGEVTEARRLTRLSDGRPYIPGSTVKGAIRTAILLELAAAQSGRRSQVPIEREIEGLLRPATTWNDRPVEAANRDLARLFRISDFHAEPKALCALIGIPSRNTLTDRQDIPIWCECLVGSRLKGTLTFEARASISQGAPEATRAALDNLFGTWQHGVDRYIDKEIAYWDRSRFKPTGDWLKRTRQDALLLNLGWGAGWPSKTIAPLLDDSATEEVAQRVARRPRNPAPEHRGFFPTTRKLVDWGGVLVPPGWVRVDARRI